MSGICTTPFKAKATPDSTLRMIMEKHGLPEDLRILIADAGFLTAALFAASGVDASHCCTTMNKVSEDVRKHLDTNFMSAVRISAAWTDCNEVRGANAKALAKVIEDPGKIPCIGDTEFAEMRRKFMEAHPELRFDARVEPHRRFIETLLRDRIMHGRIPFVELSRCYVRGDGVITQTQGVLKDVDELLRVAREDQAVPVRGEDEVFHRITCFLYALEGDEVRSGRVCLLPERADQAQ